MKIKNETYYKSGVYALKAVNSNLIYIGSTNCFKNRKNLHISSLRKKDEKRCVIEFLKPFENGDTIKFEILEVCENYLEKEQTWIDFYKNHPIIKLVNVFDADRKNSVVSDNFKHKMSNVLKTRWKDSDYKKNTIERLKKTQFIKGQKSLNSKSTMAILSDGKHKEFNSAKLAADYFNLKPATVVAAINNNRLCKGIKFYYKRVLDKEEELSGKLNHDNDMPISSRALGKTKEGSETRDTTVSPEHPPLYMSDDIVRSLWKHKTNEV